MFLRPQLNFLNFIGLWDQLPDIGKVTKSFPKLCGKFYKTLSLSASSAKLAWIKENRMFSKWYHVHLHSECLQTFSCTEQVLHIGLKPRLLKGRPLNGREPKPRRNANLFWKIFLNNITERQHLSISQMSVFNWLKSFLHPFNFLKMSHS